MPHSGAVAQLHLVVGAFVPAFDRPVPEGPGYSVLLVLHVAAAVVGFGALVTTGLQAARARRGPAALGAAGVRRYFRPGTNWPGRAVYAVPVLGFALAADSNGAVKVGNGWVVAGLLLWLVAAAVAEAVVWPGERRIQTIVSERWDEMSARPELERTCLQVAAASVALAGVFVAAVVVMVAQP
jgi:uncharacterized membrane protein